MSFLSKHISVTFRYKRDMLCVISYSPLVSPSALHCMLTQFGKYAFASSLKCAYHEKILLYTTGRRKRIGKEILVISPSRLSRARTTFDQHQNLTEGHMWNLALCGQEISWTFCWSNYYPECHFLFSHNPECCDWDKSILTLSNTSLQNVRSC